LIRANRTESVGDRTVTESSAKPHWELAEIVTGAPTGTETQKLPFEIARSSVSAPENESAADSHSTAPQTFADETATAIGAIGETPIAGMRGTENE